MIRGFQFEVVIYARISLHLFFITFSCLFYRAFSRRSSYLERQLHIERYTFCEYTLRTFLARSRESLLTRRIESTGRQPWSQTGSQASSCLHPTFSVPLFDSPILRWLVLVDYTWPSRMLRKIMSPSKRIPPTRPSSRAIVLTFFFFTERLTRIPRSRAADGYLQATYIDRRKL